MARWNLFKNELKRSIGEQKSGAVLWVGQAASWRNLTMRSESSLLNLKHIQLLGRRRRGKDKKLEFDFEPKSIMSREKKWVLFCGPLVIVMYEAWISTHVEIHKETTTSIQKIKIIRTHRVIGININDYFHLLATCSSYFIFFISFIFHMKIFLFPFSSRLLSVRVAPHSHETLSK